MLRLRITTINIISVLLISSFFSVCIGYLLIYMPLKNRNDNIAHEREIYISRQKEYIRDNVHNIIKMIDALREDAIDNHRTTMMARLESLVQSSEPAAEIVSQQLLEQCFSMWCNDKYAAWCGLVNYHGGIILERSSANLAATDAPSHNTMLATIIEQTLKTEHAVAIDSEMDHLVVVAMKVPALDAIVVLATPKHCVERQVQKDLFHHLAQIRFGENSYGYYFVIGKDRQPLLFAINDPPYHADMSCLPQPKNTAQLISEISALIDQTGDGFHSYLFQNPAKNGRVEEKIAYVAHYKPWDWIVGTGFYHSDLIEGFAAIDSRMLKDRHTKITTGAWLLFFNLLVSLAIVIWINRHISRLEHQRLEEMHELEQYKKLLDLSCLVSRSDPAGIITYANETFQKISGYSLEEMMGKPHNLFRHPGTPRKVFKVLWETIQSGKVWRGATKNMAKDGHEFYTQQVIMPITDSDGKIREYIAARVDITELLKKQEQLNLAFATDTLTALGSRLKLIKDLEQVTGAASMALIDYNNFHGINKFYGLHVGDRALIHMSETLSREFAESETRLYRLNADIFAILGDEAAMKPQRFIDLVNRFPSWPFYADEERTTLVPLAITVGLACASENLLTCADIANKEAKKNNLQFNFYDPSTANIREYQEKMVWIEEVRCALNDDRIVAFFQPIVEMSSGTVVKYECLMRLQKEDGSIIAPGAFLSVLQQTPYYVFMTHAMIKQACSVFSNRTCSFSINFSVDDLLRKETLNYLLETAKRFDVFDRLVIEVVETENIHNYDYALETLISLKELGCRISIDDFGTGYANFSYLTKMNADIVKIDGSLVQALGESESTRELVASIVRFAHSCGMQVVAEFIDRSEIAALVKELGCDYGQGYLYSPALAESELPPCPPKSSRIEHPGT